MEFRKCTKVAPKNVSATLACYMMEDHERNQGTLSEEQKQFYADNGYLIIKQLFDDALLDSFRKRFTEICNGTVNKNTVTIVKEIALLQKTSNPEEYIYKVQELLYDDIFMRYSENPVVLELASQFIGKEITVVNSMLINKPPGTSRHPPHQDLFYFPFRPAEKIMGVWTAMDHATTENGCLYVIPGSHKAKVLLEHREVKDSKKFIHGLPNEEVVAPECKRVYLDMNPGDTLFFNSYLVHGSGANTSQNYRKAMTLHFASSDCYFIDVAGTVQEGMVKEYEDMFIQKGANLKYHDLWRVKSKQLERLKSNL